MVTYQVAFSPTAARDLEKVVAYIAKDNPQAAERFGLELTEKANSLKNSQIAHNGREFLNKKGARRLVHGKYLIVYRILESQEKVRILRFWHGSRDRKTI
ncbi:MAG: type II toxin-antitoxin system RelE/ParE family toxin [Gammaproteobacteria bacterium]|nr:type II toxin-antitoxin system RelE/ParE family toxin [Gammaproteobacteria bacterium]